MTKNKTVKTLKENKDEVVTFRLSENQFKPFKVLIEKSGFKKGKVIREILLSKSKTASLPKSQSKENKRLVFLANKTSNNINQLARKLNIDYKDGIVTEATYKTLLNNLINIEKSFSKAIERC